MDVLFLGVAVSPDAMKNFSKYKKKGEGSPHPQQYFDFNVISGLSLKTKVLALSIPPIKTFPGSSCLLYNGDNEKVKHNLRIRYLFTLNIPIIKHLIYFTLILVYTFIFLLQKKRKDRVIITGHLSVVVTLPALIASVILGAKSIAIVPDVPQFINTYNTNIGIFKKVLLNCIQRIDIFLQTKYNGYVLLTEQMADLLQVVHKRYVVIEGMISPEDFLIYVSDNRNKCNAIMYAGTLHRKFGIEKLVHSFILADIESYELWICGNGDYVDDIKRISATNPSIKYFGNLNRDEVIVLERKATLLVNPRPSSEVFTKYSFPSKTLEYMASGTPLLTTDLPGIPDDYRDYILRFASEDEVSMSKRLKQVCQDKKGLCFIGKSAREYVLKNKNISVQTSKIIDFILSLS